MLENVVNIQYDEQASQYNRSVTIKKYDYLLSFDGAQSSIVRPRWEIGWGENSFAKSDHLVQLDKLKLIKIMRDTFEQIVQLAIETGEKMSPNETNDGEGDCILMKTKTINKLRNIVLVGLHFKKSELKVYGMHLVSGKIMACHMINSCTFPTNADSWFKYVQCQKVMAHVQQILLRQNNIY